MEYVGYGRIGYSSDTSQKPGWFYLKPLGDFGGYYNWLYRNGNVNGWESPLNGNHITFIAGNREPMLVNQDSLLPYLFSEYSFRYDPVVYTNGESFWIPCESEDLDTVRSELGLPVPKKFGYHITLGNLKKFRVRG